MASRSIRVIWGHELVVDEGEHQDALLDHLCGGWPSPYIQMLGSIKQEVGMFRWHVSNRHIDIVLSHHFMEITNTEICRLKLPALVPLAKRQRLSHVNESIESKV